jgi:DNA helicase-2/ATP-dependent DNA helicase PcrA
MALAAQRFTKNLWTDRTAGARPRLVTLADEAAQAEWVADAVLREREAGMALKKQAVLFRASHHSAVLELELTRRNIPFVKFGGLKFLEAAHVKDVLSVLRWAQNPRSRLAGFRVAQLVPGIGPATARRLLDAMDAAPRPLIALREFVAPAGAVDPWGELVALLEALGGGCRWPAELEQVNRWYDPHLQRLHDDAAIRAGDLAQLARIAQGYASRERFLTELTLDPPDATSDEAGAPHLDEDHLILSTIHSAKGQEWHAVTVLNVVDGCMPSDMATGSAAEIEEERRLLYVAMTRAKQSLQLMVPLRFHVHQQAGLGDRHLYASLTRFISPATAALFEQVGPATEAAGTPAVVPATVDVGARLRARWA